MARSLAWGSQESGDGALEWGTQSNEVSAITGTLSSTLSNTTSSASGTVPDNITGTVSRTLVGSTSSIEALLWNSVTFSGTPPDLGDTESFYELAINDAGFTAAINDVLYYTVSSGLTVDTQWIPVVDPAGSVSGTYYIYDVSLATYTATYPYLIDQRISGEVIETLGNTTSAISGDVLQTYTGTLSETLESTTSTFSGIVWERVVFNGTPPDLGETESFYELAINDLGFTPAINDELHYTPSTGLTVDAQTIPTISPAGTATGFYYFKDVSLATSTSIVAYTINQSFSGELSETLGGSTLDASALATNDTAGTLSETLESTTSSASGSISGIQGSLSEALESSTSTASGSLIIVGLLSETLEAMSSDSSGLVPLDIDGSLSETLGNTLSSISGVGSIDGTVEQTLESTSISSSGSAILGGSLSVTLGNTTSEIESLIVFSGSLSETLAGSTSSISGDTGADPGFISGIVEEMHLWLPDNNVLTDPQMATIVARIIDVVGYSTEEYRAEIMCKSLEAVAQVNLAKASTYYGLTREKVDRVEYHYSSGGKTPKDLWQDYIDSLADICPLFGYSKPTVIGIKINSGPTIDPLIRCKPPTSLY